MTTNWQIGDLIQNRWQIYKILKGGLGIVYVVYDHEHHAPYAAKTFQDEIFARNPAVADRFTQEALTWINLDSHQNVTDARFVEKIEGKPFLFLEYVSGGDLSGWINTPRLTEDLPQVLRFAIGFCDGISHALAKGITAHRDIKPANCLVTEDGTLKVTDFGLAKVFNDIGSSVVELEQLQSLSINLSRTGTSAGTCTHMAPEQFADAKHVDVRADVYSFGVMLYEMVTGKLPFAGRTWQDMERMHKSQPAPPPGRAPAELSKIVQRCLAKEPEQRYGGFGEAREELAAVYKRVTGEDAPEAAQGETLSAERWVNKGTSLNELGHLEEALVCFDHALLFNPRLGQAWSNKAGTLGVLGQLEEALVCVDRALAINPRHKKAWCNKGTILYRLGRLEEALACCDRALTLDQRDAESWFDKGVVLYSLRRLEEALTCYDSALEFNPRYEQVWVNKGTGLNELGHSEEALVCYDRALALDPHDVLAWNNKGTTLNSLGRSEESLACYEHALALDPCYAGAWFNKGATLFYSFQRYREALACFEEAQRLGVPQATQMIELCRQVLLEQR